MAASVAVFCGSKHGCSDRYREDAKRLGHHLASNKIELVYGAGSIGLMGELARAALDAGGEVYGVIPSFLDHVEITQTNLTTLVITETMHERKVKMFDRADAFLLLPGGLGSLDEFFEITTWAQLNLHQKPIYIYNPDHYWDPLLELIDHIITQDFANADNRTLYTVVEDFDNLMRLINAKI